MHPLLEFELVESTTRGGIYNERANATSAVTSLP
jgi:hypothetical protein